MEGEQRSGSSLSLLGRFRLGSLMWLCLMVGVLLMWHRDHSQLQLQIAMLSGRNHPAWSIDQLLGQPNTLGFGDIATAWASQMPDAGQEWVIVEFPSTVKAIGVEVYETYNPGAIIRVASVSMTGAEELIWEGSDPVTRGASPLGTVASKSPTISTRGGGFMSTYGAVKGGISKIRFAAPVSTRRIKLYLDSASFPGWNEIDAVALIDSNLNQQWASAAWAGSSFGSNREPPTWFYP